MLTPSQNAAHGFRRGLRIGGHLTLWLLVSAISPCFSESNGESPRTGQAEHRVGLADSRLGYESTRFVTDSKVVLRHKGERLPLDELARNPPLGLPPLPMPLNSAEIDLGRSLFFDRRLSVNETLSCAMCHIPEQGFTQNELSTPVGHLGKGVRRNVPSLYNVAFSKVLFLDGRETSLEAQIWSPLLAANEMANPSRVAVLTKLSGIETYRRQFEELYPAGLTETTLGRALAAYQRALLSADSPFDRWYYSEVERPDHAVNELRNPSLAEEGFKIFRDKGCDSCHHIGPAHALFTDGAFHNTGMGYLRDQRAIRPAKVQLAPGVYVVPTVDTETEIFADDGRYEVTALKEDRWRYRTPSLRNVALTAPYMHDGSLATLEQVVAFYGAGGGEDPARDPRVRELSLSQDEQRALVEFLQSLTSVHVDALVSDARSVLIGERSASGQ